MNARPGLDVDIGIGISIRIGHFDFDAKKVRMHYGKIRKLGKVIVVPCRRELRKVHKRRHGPIHTTPL